MIARLFSTLIHGLLYFLPEEKRKKWKIGMYSTSAVLLMLVGVAVGVQWIGPYAEGPTEDPINHFNRVYAATPNNAAAAYEEAIRARTEAPTKDWRVEAGRSEAPLSEELKRWINENEISYQLTRRAASIPDCAFRLSRSPNGALDLHVLRDFKLQISFIAIRARLCVERRDLEGLGECLNVLTGIADHMHAFPGAAGNLYSLAARSLAMDMYLCPYEWTDLSGEIRRSYQKQVAAVTDPVKGCADALEYERRDLCWMTGSVDTSAYSLYPEKRIYAEIYRYMDLYTALANQSPENIADPTSLVRRQIEEANDWPAFGPMAWLNVPRWGARELTHFLQAIRLGISGIAYRRALLTVDALFDYRDSHGAFPASLGELGLEETRDPYTGNDFFYEPVDGDFVLYSAGVDRDDDGGRHDSRFGRKDRDPITGEKPEPDGDYVFWPLQEND